MYTLYVMVEHTIVINNNEIDRAIELLHENKLYDDPLEAESARVLRVDRRMLRNVDILFSLIRSSLVTIGWRFQLRRHIRSVPFEIPSNPLQLLRRIHWETSILIKSRGQITIKCISE